MDALDRIIQLHGPDVVTAAFASMVSAERVARIDAVLDARLTSVTVALEDLYDPHNGAATLRSCEAFGLMDLHAIEGEHRFSANKGITRGCDRWLELHRWPDAASCLAGLRARGFRVLATAPDADVDIEDVDVSTPVAVMFGNEHAGISGASAAACDGAIAIRMHGFTESFNLSVSVALVTSRLAARRRAHLGASGDLPPDRRAHLRARWIALKIRGAIGVIQRHVSGQTRPDVALGTRPSHD